MDNEPLTEAQKRGCGNFIVLAVVVIGSAFLIIFFSIKYPRLPQNPEPTTITNSLP